MPLCVLNGQWWLTPTSERCQTRNLQDSATQAGEELGKLEWRWGQVGVAQGAGATWTDGRLGILPEPFKEGLRFALFAMVIAWLWCL